MVVDKASIIMRQKCCRNDKRTCFTADSEKSWWKAPPICFDASYTRGLILLGWTHPTFAVLE